MTDLNREAAEAMALLKTLLEKYEVVIHKDGDFYIVSCLTSKFTGHSYGGETLNEAILKAVIALKGKGE